MERHAFCFACGFSLRNLLRKEIWFEQVPTNLGHFFVLWLGDEAI